jgi:DNA-binding winged helix-turn-helix (wHTH) protein
MRLSFGECVFDTETRELIRGGRAVHLSPKAFQLLETLLAARPKALSRAALHDRLWPRTFVTATSLSRLVADVRAAIGDDAKRPGLIRTVHGFGYAFSGTLAGPSAAESTRRAAEAPALRLLWGKREIELAEGVSLLGRADGCALWLDAPGVSRRHARIVVAQGSATLEDLGSKNGTFVRGRRIASATPLNDGDEIAIGAALMTFRVFETGRSTETLRR